MTRRAAGHAALVLTVVMAYVALPAVALAARAWSLTSSPLVATVGVPVAVTLTAQNIGGDGGGDEITCITLDVPASFLVQAVTIVSVKGSSSGHGWQWLSGPAGGATRVTFKNPPDDNPLVGLPQAGDSAVFRITGIPQSSGTLTWTAGAADHPGGATSLTCGSGTFPALSVGLSVSVPVVPTPTPTPTPAPTAKPTPAATPRPTSRPSAQGSPTPTANSTPGASSPAPTSAASSTPDRSSGPRTSDVPSASPSPLSGSTGLTPGSPGDGPGGGAGADRGDVVEAAAVTVGGARGGSGATSEGLGALATDVVFQLGLAEWTVPAAAVGVPGMLVVIAVLVQLAGGMAWVPVARRSLRGVGVRRGESKIPPAPPSSGA